MELNRIHQQLKFIVEIDRLKNVLRQLYIINGERQENSAEHSWHLAMMALLLAEYTDEPVDTLKVLKMVLIHDIVEIDAGDTFCYDTNGVIDQAKREQLAADRLFGLLPEDQQDEIRTIWQEFESCTTPEARFAAALDRIMPLLHNYYTQGKSWQEHGIKSVNVLKRAARVRESSQALYMVALEIIEDAVSKGYLENNDPALLRHTQVFSLP